MRGPQGYPGLPGAKVRCLDAFVTLEDALHEARRRKSFRISIDIDI